MLATQEICISCSEFHAVLNWRSAYIPEVPELRIMSAQLVASELPEVEL